MRMSRAPLTDTGMTHHPNNACSSTTNDDAPEWAGRYLTINEFCGVTRESRSTVYRKIKAGIYPPLAHFGGSARIPGWEAWRLFNRGEAA